MLTTITFDKEFTEDLNDPNSSAFEDLESSVNEAVSTMSTGCLFPPSVGNGVLMSWPLPTFLPSCAGAMVKSQVS